MHKLFAFSLALAACSSAAADDSPSKRFERDMMVRFHMHEHFDLVRSIELLLVRGKLDDAKSLARLIVDSPDEPGLAPFAKRAAAVRERAANLAAAPNLDEACHREAKLAAACADCHVDAGVLPDLARPPALSADTSTAKARMARHVWATDRLWEGMIANSDETWRSGLDVLAATTWPSGDAEREAFTKRLRAFADSARKMQATDQLRDRAREYGDILATCAGCHAVR